MTKHFRYRVGNGFGGMGGAALGFRTATESLFGQTGSFELSGAVDFDPYACAVYSIFNEGAPEAEMDVAKMTVEDMWRIFGKTAPDVMVGSPPCKAASKLLGKSKACLPKYQAMNKLALLWTKLILKAWPDAPPRILLYENVPNITVRAREMLAEVRSALRAGGYDIQDGFHDCGAVGGLAQHRKRWFMVAALRRCKAHPERCVPFFLYKPPRKKVRGCGEELEKLPLPGDPDAGPMHELPNVAAVQWFRLASIPAGGDHRDLKHVLEGAPKRKKLRGKATDVRDVMMRPEGTFHHVDRVTSWISPIGTVTHAPAPSSGAPSVADPRPSSCGFKSSLGVSGWSHPSATITGEAYPTTGRFSVADPRMGPIPLVPQAGNANMHDGKYVVVPWKRPARTITGASRVGSGAQSVADPRFVPSAFAGAWGVRPWTDPSGAVTGNADHSTGIFAVADPRFGADGFRGAWGVLGWSEPSGAVTGNARLSTGTFSVADPLVREIMGVRKAYDHGYAILGWQEPSPTIAATSYVGCGAYSVADPRPPIALRCTPRADSYGVLSWQEAAKVITGSANVDNGAFAVADPRFPWAPPVAIIERWDRPPFRIEYTKKGKEKRIPVPLVILSEDGTWHRPLTTMELLVLQGFPAKLHGKYVQLPGGSTLQRQAIGNAIPPPSARAIAEQMLLALVAADTGCFYLDKGGEGVWVKRDGLEEQLREHGINIVNRRAPWHVGGTTVLDDGAVRRAPKKKAKAPRSPKRTDHHQMEMTS